MLEKLIALSHRRKEEMNTKICRYATGALRTSAMCIVFVASFAGHGSDASAGTGVTIDYGNVSGSSGNAEPDFLLGWTFTTNEALIVTHLGVYSGGDDGDGLQNSHEVGIFNSAGVLIASTTVGPAPAATAINSFQYSLLDVPTILGAGETYTIVGHYGTPAGGSAHWTFGMPPGPQPGLSFDPAINYVGVLFDFAPSLQMPSQGPFGPEAGYSFGPNVLFQAVPAPGALALLGIAGLAARSRRRPV
jgi:MYXO-CTERM domain-containing protein